MQRWVSGKRLITIATTTCEVCLQADEVARWIGEATRKVDAANTTSGLVSEASLRVKDEAHHCRAQSEASQAHMHVSALGKDGAGK